MGGDKRQRSWLRHYATNWKIADSNPDEVIGFFNRLNPSSRTMALGSTQPLTEMSTRNLPGGKGRPVRKADNLIVYTKCGSLDVSQPYVASRPVKGIDLPYPVNWEHKYRDLVLQVGSWTQG
jgi:hypothetical protein